jgi:transcriptional regulator with GAF, ATPase, and Fis domain
LERQIDFRLVVASNRDLYRMCQDGAFREDLYYRINLTSLEIPPLRERVEDIIPLADLFLEELDGNTVRTRCFPASAMKAYSTIPGPERPGTA